mmetsp:Transcript_12135/g.34776  ORF Transcript_12135/g.34776 Transcript_12135/m.34776 type:complete len:400 (-) Transcript_12135:18-1217(-)
MDSSTKARTPMEMLCRSRVKPMCSTSSGWPGKVRRSSNWEFIAKPSRPTSTPKCESSARMAKPSPSRPATPFTERSRSLRVTFASWYNTLLNSVTSRMSITRSAQSLKRSATRAWMTCTGGYRLQSSVGFNVSTSKRGHGGSITGPTSIAAISKLDAPFSATTWRRPSQRGSLRKPPTMPASMSPGREPVSMTIGESPPNEIATTCKSAAHSVKVTLPRGTGNSGAIMLVVGSMRTAVLMPDLPTVTLMSNELPSLSPSTSHTISMPLKFRANSSVKFALESSMPRSPICMSQHRPVVKVKFPMPMGSSCVAPAGRGMSKPCTQCLRGSAPATPSASAVRASASAGDDATVAGAKAMATSNTPTRFMAASRVDSAGARPERRALRALGGGRQAPPPLAR